MTSRTAQFIIDILNLLDHNSRPIDEQSNPTAQQFIQFNFKLIKPFNMEKKKKKKTKICNIHWIQSQNNVYIIMLLFPAPSFAKITLNKWIHIASKRN